MNIVFTGSATDPEGMAHRRSDLGAECAALGWRMQLAVDSTTTALVASDGALRSGSTKVQAARRAGIQVRPYSWFFAHLRAEQRSRNDHARAAARGQTVRAPENRSGFSRDIDVMAPLQERHLEHIESRSVRQSVDMDGLIHDLIVDRDGNEVRRENASGVQRRGRRMMAAPNWHPWTSPPDELSSMEFDWVGTWTDRTGCEAQWRLTMTGEVYYRLSRISGQTVCEDVLWPAFYRAVDLLRQAWIAKNEPPEPAPFQPRTVRRRML